MTFEKGATVMNLRTTGTVSLRAGGVISLMFLAALEALAQVPTTLTSSGLNTHVEAPSTLPSGQTNYDITGGTRPGGGTNLFHSFGAFNVGSNSIANFFNETSLPTNNILARVTGGSPSNIFGALQTTGFGNANLFLINPAGVVFGPTASLNVGGSLTVTTANYVTLADGVRFNAAISPADALLSSAPISAFGFLGSSLPVGQAGMITVQPGATLTVSTGQTISLVGRDNLNGAGQQAGVVIDGGIVKAESGRINLISVGNPIDAQSGGEVGATTAVASWFQNKGSINVQNGAVISTSTETGANGGVILIRGGQLTVTNSSLSADGPLAIPLSVSSPAGTIDVHADSVTLNQASISASSGRGTAGTITFSDLTSLDSNGSVIAAKVTHHLANDATTRGGSISIGSPSTQTVTLTNSQISASTMASAPGIGFYTGDAGDITVSARNLTLNGASIGSVAGAHSFRAGGLITFNGDRIAVTSSSVDTYNDSNGSANGVGAVYFQGHNSTASAPTTAKSVLVDDSSIVAGMAVGTYRGGNIVFHSKGVTLNNSLLKSHGYVSGGNINLTDVNTLQIVGSTLSTVSSGSGGTISLGSSATDSISLQNSNVTTLGVAVKGGRIDIRAAKQYESIGSSVQSDSVLGNGGAVSIRSNKVSLAGGSSLSAQGPQGEGTITLDYGNKLTIKDTTITPSATITSGWKNE